MYLITGLGNPGREYAATRHNIGYMTLDILAGRHDIDIRRRSFRGVFGEGRIGGEKVMLLKPETFMNLSGECVRDFMNFYKCGPDKLILIYDDADLEPGDIRIRANGSGGSHNGISNVIYQLQRDDFPRVRVGIGKNQYGDMIAHVLSAPNAEQTEAIKTAMEHAADAAELIVAGRLNDAQARFNTKHRRETPDADE